MSSNFNNTLKLTIFTYKREIINTLIWLVILVGLTFVVAIAFNNIYATGEDLMGIAETMRNPAMIAMVGPIFDINNYTIGAMMGQMMLLFTVIAVCFMNIFIVVRHTRKDEEALRVEVVRSLPVGRLSNLLSTLIICFDINVLFSIVIGFGLYFLNISSMDLNGSLLYGAGIGVVGFLFASIGAIFSQLASTSRGAYSYSFMFIGITYLIRAYGDIKNNILAYISPLGLVLRTEVYVTNRWFPILILFLLSIICSVIAIWINSKRDLGAGIIPAKNGRSEASKYLSKPIGFTARLLKSSLITWFIILFMLGASYGSVFGDLESFLDSSEMLKQMFLQPGVNFTFAEQFLSTLMVIYSIVVTIVVLLLLLRVRTEEKKGRLEQIYSKKVSRNKLLGSYVLISFISSIVLTFLYGFGLWIAAFSVMTDPISFLTVFKASMVYLPAIWVMLGVGVLFISFLPKLTKLIWVYLGLSFFVVYLGKILQLPTWVEKLTPYGNVPRLPIETMNWTSLIVLTIISIVLIIIGFYGYRKRDIING